MTATPETHQLTAPPVPAAKPRRRGPPVFAVVAIILGVVLLAALGVNYAQTILHPRVRIHSYTDVDESILMDGVEIGRHSKLRRAIIDKGVKIPSNATIGYDLESDRQRFTVTDSGIVVVSKGAVVEEPVPV